MSTQFSENDFTVFQNQLLTLRELNCQLEDKCKKQEKDLSQFRDRISVLEKEINKSNQIIARSKIAKACENLIEEIDVLQSKLQTQEDDFRFQNQELMHQLSELMITNESLEHKLSQAYLASSAKSDSSNNSLFHHEDELRRLKAENLALQSSINTYREDACDLSNINSKIYNENNSSTDKISDSKSEDLLIKLNTELAEKELLKKQLMNLQSEKLSLESELINAKEKLKKKQESMLQLQNDNDNLYEKMSKEIEESKMLNSIDLSKLETEISALKAQISSSDIKHQSQINSAAETINQLEQKIIDTEIIFKKENNSNNIELLECIKKHEDTKVQQEQNIQQLISNNEKLNANIMELEKSLNFVKDQNYDLQHDRDKQISLLQEMTKLAENRKTALDKLSVDQQEKMDSWQKKINQLNIESKEKILNLEKEREILKLSLMDLRSVEATNNSLKNQLHLLEISNSELEENLKDTKDELEKGKEIHETNLQNILLSHKNEISDIRNQLLNEMEIVQKGLQEKDSVISSLRDEIVKLNQDIVDQIEDKRNHEKRGAIHLRELKKQVNSEMQRANKLQEKLQEILGDSRGRSSLDELFRLVDQTDSQRNFDTSSLSSWSPSGHSRDNVIQSSEEDQQNFTMRRENEAMIKRIADLQFKISTMEEKVYHLEESNSMMADDLIEKKSIIDHYIMESRAGQSIGANDKLTMKRLFDYMIEKNDDNTKEINKKLQNVLEETLTKNMHLQNDLDLMAKQLSEFSK